MRRNTPYPARDLAGNAIAAMSRSAASVAAFAALVVALQVAVIPRASAVELTIPSATCLFDDFSPWNPGFSLVCSEADLVRWTSARGMTVADLVPEPERLADGALDQGLYRTTDGERVLFARYIHDQFTAPPPRTRAEVRAAYLATLGITEEQALAGSTFTPAAETCPTEDGFAVVGKASTQYSGRVRLYKYCDSNPAGRYAGRTVLYIEGHGESFKQIAMDTISWLADLGFEVYAADITLWGTNLDDDETFLRAHEDYAYFERSPVSPLWTELLAPYVSFYSFIRERAAGPIGIAGRSGGGMTAYSVAVVQPEVDYVFSIAGGTPMSMRLASGPLEIGDWEQWSPRTYRFVGYEELMRSAGRLGGIYTYGGRDPCCFRVAAGDGFFEWMNTPAVDGRVVELVVDPQHDEHSLSENSKPAVLDFLDRVLAVAELTVAVSGDGSGKIISDAVGIDCGSICASSFDVGTLVMLTASPASGSVFAGWSGGGCAGTGVCAVTMDAAKSVTANFSLATSIPRLSGISTRVGVLTGDNVLIGGFVIGGSTPKTVVVNARGPSLTGQGVAGALANPTLMLVPASGTPTTNDDWGSAPNAATIQSLGLAPPNALESSILATLDPGAYTAIVSGVGGATGVGIVEVFEVDHPENPLIGISTRGRVQAGDNVLVGGFIIKGNSPQSVVVRARGPSLISLGVGGALANPTLTLVPASGTPITNDDWGTAANASTLQASGFAPTDARESAILVTLDPGAYTAIVSAADGGSGVAIVEVFPR